MWPENFWLSTSLVWMCNLMCEYIFSRILFLLLTPLSVTSPLWELWRRCQLSSSLISVLSDSVALSPGGGGGGGGLRRCTCHCNRLIIACGAGRLERFAPPPHSSLLGDSPGASAHWGWITHNYRSDRACSHLPSSPAVSLTHLAHMTNDRNRPNLRPLTRTW